MEYNYYTLFLLFFIYAVLGYIIESSFVSIETKKVVFNRGFLIGPYLPIFGFGGLIMAVTLQKYSDDLLALFLMGMTSCLVLEYITSYILEKLFNLRWWDYSKKHFNLNGRICLDYGIMFGLLGILLIKFVNPFIESILLKLSNNTLMIIAIILTIVILTDLFISTKTIMKLHKNLTRCNKDSTSEIKAKVLEELNKKIFLY